MEAAAGDERDLDAARRRLDQRVAMRVGKASAAVEQRAVDVDGEETDHRAIGIDDVGDHGELPAGGLRTSVN